MVGGIPLVKYGGINRARWRKTKEYSSSTISPAFLACSLIPHTLHYYYNNTDSPKLHFP